MLSAKRSAQWLDRRFALARPVDPGDRSAGAQRHPRGTVSRRARRQELGARRAPAARGADPQSVLCGLFRGRDRRRLRAGLSAGDRGDRFPARSRCARATNCWRARSRSISPRRPIRKARSPIALICDKLAALARRFGFIDASPTNAIAKSTANDAPHGMLEAAGPDFANVVVFHSLSKRSNLPGLRIGFAAGDRRFLASLSRIAQCRGAASADADAARRHRRLWRREPCRGEPAALSREIRSRRSDHRRPLRLSPARRRIFPLARRLGAGRQREGDANCCGARPACASCPAAISRASRPTAAIPARIISASPWCRTTRSPPRRCIASSRCSG